MIQEAVLLEWKDVSGTDRLFQRRRGLDRETKGDGLEGVPAWSGLDDAQVIVQPQLTNERRSRHLTTSSFRQELGALLEVSSMKQRGKKSRTLYSVIRAPYQYPKALLHCSPGFQLETGASPTLLDDRSPTATSRTLFLSRVNGMADISEAVYHRCSSSVTRHTMKYAVATT